MNPLVQAERKRNIIIAIAAGVFLLIVVLIFFFVNRDTTPRIKIDNLNSVPNLSNNIKNSLETGLYRTISSNTEEKVPTSGALIRTNTIISEYDNSTNIYYGNFIIDIAAVQQSYYIQFEWSKDKNNDNLSSTPVLISCVRDENLIVYPNFQCKDQFSYNSETDDADIYLSSYLPHIESLSTGDNFVVLDNGVYFLMIQLDDCYNAALVSEAINKTNSWLESLGLDYSKFTIQTMKSCNSSH